MTGPISPSAVQSVTSNSLGHQSGESSYLGFSATHRLTHGSAKPVCKRGEGDANPVVVVTGTAASVSTKKKEKHGFRQQNSRGRKRRKGLIYIISYPAWRRSLVDSVGGLGHHSILPGPHSP